MRFAILLLVNAESARDSAEVMLNLGTGDDGSRAILVTVPDRDPPSLGWNARLLSLDVNSTMSS